MSKSSFPNTWGELLFAMGFTALIIGVILSFKIWLFGSVITSSVKTISNDCHKTYGVESFPLINGNWFCPKKGLK